jgi:hypothetical protein
MPSLSLQAQSGRYVIEQRYVQQLVWVEDQYVLKYEVVIERDEGRGYRAFMREFTEKNNFQISLVPGKYRYQVIPFDYLEQPGESSGWIFLNILPGPIVPVEVQTTGDNYLLRSDTELIPGVNEIVIKNPDELKTKEGVLIVEKQRLSDGEKQFNFFLSALWSPLLPLYGGMQEVYGNEIYLASTVFRFGVIYNNLKWWFDPGVELSTSWYTLNKVQAEYTIGMQGGVIGFNFLAQKRLPNQKMALTLRAGSGLGFQTGELTSDLDIYPTGGLLPQVNLDFSYLWQFWRQLYFEAGLSYNLFISKDNSSGCLRPWLGAGWNF